MFPRILHPVLFNIFNVLLAVVLLIHHRNYHHRGRPRGYALSIPTEQMRDQKQYRTERAHSNGYRLYPTSANHGISTQPIRIHRRMRGFPRGEG